MYFQMFCSLPRSKTLCKNFCVCAIRVYRYVNLSPNRFNKFPEWIDPDLRSDFNFNFDSTHWDRHSGHMSVHQKDFNELHLISRYSVRVFRNICPLVVNRHTERMNSWFKCTSAQATSACQSHFFCRQDFSSSSCSAATLASSSHHSEQRWRCRQTNHRELHADVERTVESKRVSVNGRRCDRDPWKGRTKGTGLFQREQQGQIQLQTSLKGKKQETWTERTTRVVDRWPPAFLKWQTWAHCSRLQNVWCQRYSIDTSGTCRHILVSGAHPGTNVIAQPSRSSTSDLSSLTRYVNHCQSNASMMSCFATMSESDERVFFEQCWRSSSNGLEPGRKKQQRSNDILSCQYHGSLGSLSCALWLSTVAFRRWKGQVDGWLFGSEWKSEGHPICCSVISVRSCESVAALQKWTMTLGTPLHDLILWTLRWQWFWTLMSVMTRRLRSSSRRPVLCWIWFSTEPRPVSSLRGRVATAACAVAVCCDSLCRSLNWERVTLLIRHCLTYFPVRSAGSLLNSASARNCWLESAQTSFSSLLILSVRDRLRMPNSLRLDLCLLPCGALSIVHWAVGWLAALYETRVSTSACSVMRTRCCNASIALRNSASVIPTSAQ